MFSMVWGVAPGGEERAWGAARRGVFPAAPRRRHGGLARLVPRLMRAAPAERDTAATVVAKMDALLPRLAHPGEPPLVRPARARELASADARRSAHVARPPPVALRVGAQGGSGAGGTPSAGARTARASPRARRAMST